jgi:diguanylate cyclase (GGDEF)-like protein
MKRDPGNDGLLPPGAGPRPRPARARWNWATFREGLVRRQDGEHAFGFARLALLFLWLAYCLATASSPAEGLVRPATLVTVLALATAAWLLNEAAKDPAVAPRRRMLAIVLDQAFVFLSLFFLGERGAWLLPLSLMVSIANGLHFGRSYGLFAAVLSAAGYSAVITLRPEAWSQAPITSKAIAAALFIIPAYVAIASERLLNATDGYRARARKIARSAMEDPLTGLANRAFLKKGLGQAIERAKPGDIEEGFAVLYCDLDNFKLINETHGHVVGDRVLRQVSDALKKCVRSSDIVARLGGDEFAVCLSGISDAEIAKRIGRNIVAAVRAIESVDSTQVQLACSVGITMFQAPLGEGVQAEGVLALADEAMSQAKRAGKNQFYLQWANL